MIISELLRNSIEHLENAGIETPILDAEIILSYVLNLERYRLITERDRILSNIEINTFNKLLKRRINREPIAYITGVKEFYSLNFFVNKNVLIPRPETELLVDLAIYYAKQGGYVFDLGTGSGAIAISLKYNRRDLTIFASDISVKAITAARKNEKSILKKRSISFLKGDMFEPVKGKKFDLIVTNPPYVDPAIRASLQKELTFEPELALFSDNHGKMAIQQIISESNKYLNKDGMMLMEIGPEMSGFIKELGDDYNFVVSILSDYSGLPRIATFSKPNVLPFKS